MLDEDVAASSEGTRLFIAAITAYYLPRVCPSICPHMSERLPLDGFPWNSTLRNFINNCRGISQLVKIDKKIPATLREGLNRFHFFQGH